MGTELQAQKAQNQQLQSAVNLHKQEVEKPQVEKVADRPLKHAPEKTAANKNTLKALAKEHDISVYGQIDLGVEHINNVSGSGDITRLSSGIGTSYLGIHGKEYISENLRAIWNLETGFSPDNGTSLQGGRIFGRQAYLGLEGKYGSLTLGRQYNVRFLAWKELNPFGAGSHGITTLDEGYTGTARSDNSIRYILPIGGFTVGGNYSFGRDAVKGTSVVASNCAGEADDDNECREWAVMAKYDAKNWGLSSAYERIYGGTAATYGGLTSPDITDSRFLLGAYYMIDKAKIAVGWVKRDNQGIDTPQSNLVWVSAKVPVTKNISVDGMLGQIRYDNSPDKAQAIVLRGVYSLSKRTELYMSAEHMSNSGDLDFAATNSSPKVAPPAGGSQFSVITGIKFRWGENFAFEE
ncbi:MAG: porin [Enterobacterales bacterium endosymbiont of Blomia tropicalis]|uniref:porin n=1 Tax=Mixta mediterraneensis TaxID=2758443 RepID=UPI0025A81DB6|nr:porin [Mixta mediterraneensis]MDL4915106.1 porin [Mixta mediterraneensis]